MARENRTPNPTQPGRLALFGRGLADVLQPLPQLIGLVWLLVYALLPSTAEPVPDPASRFRAAIQDAAFRQNRNVPAGLMPITEDNPEIEWKSEQHETLLVVTLATAAKVDRMFRDADGTRHGVTRDKWPELWVTLAPELRTFCTQLSENDPTDRLKERLGLYPTGAYEFVVEMWVTRDDLFRPCPDPEVDDTTCQLSTNLDADDIPREVKVKGIDDYRVFLLSLHEGSYHPDGMPWTGLGYTYDWAHGAVPTGASEYVLVPNASYEVKSIQTPAAYCANGNA